MEQRADLHLHTNHSDGALSVEQPLRKALARGLSTLSITDHDTVLGVDEAAEIGKSLGVEVVPGVELSATLGDHEVHILGYFVDQRDEEFKEYLTFFRQQRYHRAVRIVEKLNALSVPVRLDSVLEQAGKAAIGRPHIANALVEAGLAESYYQAFDQYIGNGRPAYECKFRITPRDTIDLIARAGGIAVLAHPSVHTTESMLTQLVKDGLDGVEVIHPSHSPGVVTYYRGIAAEYFLLESGGSDFHGGRRDDDDAFGRFSVPVKFVEEMKRRLFDFRRRSVS